MMPRYSATPGHPGLLSSAVAFVEVPLQEPQVQNAMGGYVRPGGQWFREPVIPCGRDWALVPSAFPTLPLCHAWTTPPPENRTGRRLL